MLTPTGLSILEYIAIANRFTTFIIAFLRPRKDSTLGLAFDTCDSETESHNGNSLYAQYKSFS